MARDTEDGTQSRRSVQYNPRALRVLAPAQATLQFFETLPICVVKEACPNTDRLGVQ